MKDKYNSVHCSALMYVRCINNAGFIYDQHGQLFDKTIADLVVGQVYKVAPPHENDGDMLRVIDASGEDYLYPASYFEPLSVVQLSRTGARSLSI